MKQIEESPLLNYLNMFNKNGKIKLFLTVKKISMAWLNLLHL